MPTWATVTVLCSLLALHNAQRMAPVALYEELKVRLSVDYVGVGNLFGAYLIAYAVCNIPAGMLADRFDARRLVAVGAVLSVAASAVFATATSYPIAIAARMILGLAGALIYIPSVRSVVANFPKAKRGTVMGFLEMGAGAGQILSLTLLPFLAGQWDLARAFLALPAFGVLVLAGVLLVLPSSRPVVSANSGGRLLQLARSSRFWNLIVFHFLGMLAIYAISGWLPTFARVDFGYTAVQAGLVGALVNVSLSLFSPLAGVISDRMRSRPPVLLAGAILMAACLAVLAISRDHCTAGDSVSRGGERGLLHTRRGDLCGRELLRGWSRAGGIRCRHYRASSLVALRSSLRLHPGDDRHVRRRVGAGPGHGRPPNPIPVRSEAAAGCRSTCRQLLGRDTQEDRLMRYSNTQQTMDQGGSR